MALDTDLTSKVADARSILPFFNITGSVIVEGEAVTLYTKVLGNKDVPGQQNKGNKGNCHP